jgi:predicted dehydrogenase
MPGTKVLWIIDPDEKRGATAVKDAIKWQGHEPKFARDMREAFADKSVDIVSIATPHHWHTLAAIWAMQAGKDVYVEKPISHNVSEGQRLVEAVNKYGKVCQTGTQIRSMPGVREAIKFIHDGGMGEVKLARGLCYKTRTSIEKRGIYAIPAGIDYNLWCGPAPMAPLTRSKLHYDWHWQWPYGNGDLGNQGVHQMDIARWGLGLNRLCNTVVSYGGRVGYEDAGDTPNTQVVMCDYGDKALTFEVRGLETGNYKNTSARVGVIFEGTDGRTLVIPSYHSATLFDPAGKEIQTFGGPGDDGHHFKNFLDTVRNREVDNLNANVVDGHLSAALCHLGNISYCLGEPTKISDIGEKLPAICGPAAQETFERTKAHLDENEIEEDTKLTLGATLKFDPSREEFIDNPLANAYMTRDRAPFVVPGKGQV